MQFSCSFWSVQLNWIYLVVGRSPATSNSIALYMFMHKISRVVCVNGKHPCNTSQPTQRLYEKDMVVNVY